MTIAMSQSERLFTIAPIIRDLPLSALVMHEEDVMFDLDEIELADDDFVLRLIFPKQFGKNPSPPKRCHAHLSNSPTWGRPGDHDAD